MKARLIFDDPGGGAWNMAADDALLDSAADGGLPTLRIYQWSEATLSLGYFQRAGERQQHSASQTCPLVRRHSGGGAILHHHEWTYSLTAPVVDRVSGEVRELFHSVHAAIVQALTKLGIPAVLWESTAEKDAGAEPFLCFQRRGNQDIVLDGWKICGSAQRRRRQAVLQHGSILLARSEFAPELPGLEELTSTPLDPVELRRLWVKELETSLGWSFALRRFSRQELADTGRLVKEKYRNESWLLRKP